MNPVELLRFDDQPDGSGNHLTQEQRLDAFERMWNKLDEATKSLLQNICD